MINLRKKVKSSELYTEFVKALNGVLQLSKREAEVFSLLLSMRDWGDNINATPIRSAIKAELGLVDSSLSRALRILKSKGIIYRLPNRYWAINQNLLPTNNEADILEIVFTLELTDDRLATSTGEGFSEEI